MCIVDDCKIGLNSINSKRKKVKNFEERVVSYIEDNDYYTLEKIEDLTEIETYNLLEYADTKNMIFYLLSRGVNIFDGTVFQNEEVKKEVEDIRKDCCTLIDAISDNIGIFRKIYDCFICGDNNDIIDEILDKSDLFYTIGLNEAGETISYIILKYGESASINFSDIIVNAQKVALSKARLKGKRAKMYTERDFMSAAILGDVKKVENMVNRYPFLSSEASEYERLKALGYKNKKPIYSKVIDIAFKKNLKVWNVLIDKLIELDDKEAKHKEPKFEFIAERGESTISCLMKDGDRASGKKSTFANPISEIIMESKENINKDINRILDRGDEPNSSSDSQGQCFIL